MSRAHFYFSLFLYDHSRNRISSSSDRNWQSICRVHFLLFLFGGSPVVFSCCCPPLFHPLLLKIVVMANHHHHHHRSCGGGGDHRGESIALAKRSIERVLHSGRKCYYSTASSNSANANAINNMTFIWPFNGNAIFLVREREIEE